MRFFLQCYPGPTGKQFAIDYNARLLLGDIRHGFTFADIAAGPSRQSGWNGHYRSAKPPRS